MTMSPSPTDTTPTGCFGETGPVVLGDVQASFQQDHLRVGNTAIERVWRLTPQGLKSVRIIDVARGDSWVCQEATAGADWSLRRIADGSTELRPESLRIEAVSADGRSRERLEVEAIFFCPWADSGFHLRYRVWIYPGVPGMRIQLGLRAARAFAKEEIPLSLGCGSWSERLTLHGEVRERFAVGYYNDTQHRNFDETPLWKTTRSAGLPDGMEETDWANLLSLETARTGLTWVKESHKCVNQPGLDTGAFVLHGPELTITGLGYDNVGFGYAASQTYHVPGEWRDAWAHWLVVHAPGDAPRQLAVKQFDRARFHPKAEANLSIRCNTWGSRGAWAAQDAPEEANVLREIAACADLGVEQLAIDDGWEIPRGMREVDHREMTWRPHPTRFPHGWDAVVAAARQAGIRLALWLPGRTDLDDMIANYEAGDFDMYKLDFLSLQTRDDLETFVAKVSALVRHTGGKLRLSFDATESNPRMGYFLGREWGNVYLENREKPGEHLDLVVYKPHLVLRDAWMLAHYVNLNQIELTAKNVRAVPPALSDAHAHTQAYAFAQTMMGLPLFFEEMQTFDAASRDELRPLLQLYKEHRAALYARYVFPVGALPDNRSWSGFFAWAPDEPVSYLTLFRQHHNDEPEARLALPFMAHAHVRHENLVTGESGEQVLDADGALRWRLTRAPDFAFLRLTHTDG